MKIRILHLLQLKRLESTPKPRNYQSHKVNRSSSLFDFGYHQIPDGEVFGLDISVSFGKDGFRPWYGHSPVPPDLCFGCFGHNGLLGKCSGTLSASCSRVVVSASIAFILTRYQSLSLRGPSTCAFASAGRSGKVGAGGAL